MLFNNGVLIQFGKIENVTGQDTTITILFPNAYTKNSYSVSTLCDNCGYFASLYVTSRKISEMSIRREGQKGIVGGCIFYITIGF